VVETAIELQYHRAQLCVLTGVSPSLEVISNKDLIIQEIRTDGTSLVKSGQIISPGKAGKFKVRSIKQFSRDFLTGKFQFQLWYDEINISSILLLPMLCPVTPNIRNLKQGHFFWSKYLVNCYVQFGDSKVDFSNPNLYLVYRFSANTEFLELETWLENNPNFVSRTELDYHHVMFEMRVPENRVAEFLLITKGKYSWVSKAYKTLLQEFHGWEIHNKWYKIIHRVPSLKAELENKIDTVLPEDAELHDIMDIDKMETYQWDMLLN
jgi:hypothetical protein